MNVTSERLARVRAVPAPQQADRAATLVHHERARVAFLDEVPARRGRGVRPYDDVVVAWLAVVEPDRGGHVDHPSLHQAADRGDRVDAELASDQRVERV